MDPVLLVGLAALCGGAALALGAVVVGAEDRQRLQRSLAAVSATRIGGAPVLEQQDAPFADRVVRPVFAAMTGLARRFSPTGFADNLQHKLDVAGNPAGSTVERVLALKGFGLVLGAVFGVVVGSGPLALVLGVAFAAAGLFLPDLLIHNMGQKRQDQVGRSLPDSLDLLTISVEAGLGFDAALSQVARNTEGPLAGEFFRVLQEMQIGKSRSEAFRSMSARTTVPELRQFVSSLVQADQFGIPVAQVLREQSKELRLKRRQLAEEKAQKVPVKIMVPLVLFIFPVLFIVILGPALAAFKG
jgi:tight adherence protein C